MPASIARSFKCTQCETILDAEIIIGRFPIFEQNWRIKIADFMTLWYKYWYILHTTEYTNTWCLFPARDTPTASKMENTQRSRKLKKGSSRSPKKDPIEFDHLHEDEISFWGKWRGASMLCGILLRVGREKRSNSRTIKNIEYLERQRDGTYLNVDNNTRSRDLAQAAANQAYISHGISFF